MVITSFIDYPGLLVGVPLSLRIIVLVVPFSYVIRSILATYVEKCFGGWCTQVIEFRSSDIHPAETSCEYVVDIVVGVGRRAADPRRVVLLIILCIVSSLATRLILIVI